MNRTVFFRHFSHLAAAAALVCITGAAIAVPEAQFQTAFAQFNKAAGGDGSAIDDAAEAFSGLLKSEPTNPVLMAYAGAATAMKATTTMLPWKKMGFAEDGMAQEDKALALLTPAHEAVVQNGTPGVLEVKFVVANTFLAVPGFMHRAERGNKLLGEVLASPLLASAPLGFKGAVWMRAALEANKAKNPVEAKRYLDLVIQQHAPQAARAEAMLKALQS